MSIQAFAGYLRPSPPPPPPPPSSSLDNKVVTNKSSSVRDIPNNSTFDEVAVTAKHQKQPNDRPLVALLLLLPLRNRIYDCLGSAVIAY